MKLGSGASADRAVVVRLALVAIVLVGAGLRFGGIGRSSLWYDEVVTMELARQPGPGALLARLPELDATRAPMHPLVLQGWVAVFGASDVSGRALSALSGLLTVVLVYEIGREVFESRATGLISSWLVAVSPQLVVYSREARMYAWLTCLTCLSWWLVFRMARNPRRWMRVAYVLALAGLGYTHPLGLLMAGALGLATLVQRRRLGLSLAGWVAVHGAAGLLVLPWVPNYLDHPPAIASREWLSLRYVVGLPIGFVGGNVVVLVGCLVVLGAGLVGDIRPRVGVERPFSVVVLLIWFLVPPVLLYGYSWLRDPIFGQARYTLFVGPAYLILLGRGLARLPWPVSAPVVVGLAVLSGMMLEEVAYRAGLRADWRAASEYLKRVGDDSSPVVVFSIDPRFHRAVDVARYYLGSDREVYPASEAPEALREGRRSVWHSVGLREGRPVATQPPLPEGENAKVVDFPGLRLILLRGWASRDRDGE